MGEQFTVRNSAAEALFTVFGAAAEQTYPVDTVWPSPRTLVPKTNDLKYYAMEVEGVVLFYAKGVEQDHEFMANLR